MSEENTQEIVDEVIENEEVLEDDGEIYLSNDDVDEEETQEASSENVEELQDQIEDAIEDGASQEEIKEMIEEFELKVNGKTLTKKLDWNDKESVKKELQMAAAGRHSMQELAEIKKLYTNEIGRLQEDPWSVLQELGMNPEELAEGLLRQKIEEAEKSPEQREADEMRAELDKARKELDKQKTETEHARMSQLETEAAQELESEIEEALDSYTTLPKSPKTVARIADTMLWAMQNGFEDVQVKDVIPTVEDEIRKELQEFMSQLPGEMFDQYLGKKNMERLRQKRLNDVKGQPNKKDVKSIASSVKNHEEKPKKRMRSKDFFKTVGK